MHLKVAGLDRSMMKILTGFPVLFVTLILVDDLHTSFLIVGGEQDLIKARVSLLFVHKLLELGEGDGLSLCAGKNGRKRLAR